MKLKKHFLIILGFLIFVATITTGCGAQQRYQKSSVVDYLYPDKAEPAETPTIPVLSLPIKVGIAFVPFGESKKSTVPSLLHMPDPNFSERDRIALMQEVSGHFKKYQFVKSIELIPSAYLTPGGSFSNLDQLRTMFGVDVIALLSYDQAQFTDQGSLSLSYWTLVGAYVMQGEKNDTNTMMDAAVYHIQSRKMLFRAPGISRIKGSATPVNLSEQLRLDSAAGFNEAAKDLVVNLQIQLDLFREKVKSSPEEFKVISRAGSTGGGEMDAFSLTLVIGMGTYWLWQREFRG